MNALIYGTLLSCVPAFVNVGIKIVSALIYNRVE